MSEQHFRFFSNRIFVLFSFSMSHGLLLLRSSKTDDDPTRLDVLIQDVRAMEVRAWFEGIQIEEVSRDYLAGR